jgi:hypothetical protein
MVLAETSSPCRPQTIEKAKPSHRRQFLDEAGEGKLWKVVTYMAAWMKREIFNGGGTMLFLCREFQFHILNEGDHKTRMVTTRMNTTRMNTTRMNTTRMNTTRMNTTRMNTTRMNTTSVPGKIYSADYFAENNFFISSSLQ